MDLSEDSVISVQLVDVDVGVHFFVWGERDGHEKLVLRNFDTGRY